MEKLRGIYLPNKHIIPAPKRQLRYFMLSQTRQNYEMAPAARFEGNDMVSPELFDL